MTQTLQILAVSPEPAQSLPYLNAGGRGRLVETSLPILEGTVASLPEGLDAIVLASDLQGREGLETRHPLRLLGEGLAEHLLGLSEAGVFPNPATTGVLLAGDLYTVPDLKRRGGLGDVRSVWRAFGESFRWLAGVAGNHDTFGSEPGAFERFQRRGVGHLLDASVAELDGYRVGGVSGIIGNPRKPNRRDEEVFVAAVEKLLGQRIDVLVLHEPPKLAEHGLRGHSAIREALEAVDWPLLVVCGHRHWDQPVVRLGQVQVVNVDARVVILRATGS